MTPSKLWIVLGILIFLWLPPTTAAADEEIATAAELSRLAARQRELQAKLDARLRSQVDALIEDKLGRILAVHTTQLLRWQIRLAARRDDDPPAALRAATNSRQSNSAPQVPNTICTMVGPTFKCVFRDVASPQ